MRAAADIVGDDLVVVGSQAILAQFPAAPPELLVSLEVDVFPLNEPERSHEIDASIGDGSLFSVEAVRHGLADARQLEVGVDLMPEEDRELVRERLERVVAQTAHGATA